MLCRYGVSPTLKSQTDGDFPRTGVSISFPRTEGGLHQTGVSVYFRQPCRDLPHTGASIPFPQAGWASLRLGPLSLYLRLSGPPLLFIRLLGASSILVLYIFPHTEGASHSPQTTGASSDWEASSSLPPGPVGGLSQSPWLSLNPLLSGYHLLVLQTTLAASVKTC